MIEEWIVEKFFLSKMTLAPIQKRNLDPHYETDTLQTQNHLNELTLTDIRIKNIGDTLCAPEYFFFQSKLCLDEKQMLRTTDLGYNRTGGS